MPLGGFASVESAGRLDRMTSIKKKAGESLEPAALHT